MMAQEYQILYRSPAGKQWEKVGAHHHHGINVPLFSLRSSKSCGIGEYTDLIPLIDWCHEIGFDVIQTLPLNDTGLETSPYSALSGYALSPLYLGLAELPNLSRHPDLIKSMRDIQSLPESQRVQYSAVREMKNQFLQEYFRRERETIFEDEDYKIFISENDWLEWYALFKVLKITYHGSRWEEWPEPYNNPDIGDISRYREQFNEKIEFHTAVQYLCFKQLQKVKSYASEHNVLIKGDIPILISHESADVWINRSLFNLNYSAGAPPDTFNELGQNWDCPIYHWEEIQKNHYKWWKQRIRFCNYFYHLYRIDHVIGFYRIWAIPKGKEASEGEFIPKEEQTWIEHGEKLMLMMLNESPMLPIGEDLGVVPPEIRQNLKKLGICSTKVMRWEREWERGSSFVPIENYPAASMTTVSTHDSETLEMWWKDHSDEAEAFAEYQGWGYYKNLSREHRYQILWDSHHTGSLFHINLLQEYLDLVPGFSWPNPEDERINYPGIVSDINWTFRFKPSLEEIIANTTLKFFMQNLIK